MVQLHSCNISVIHHFYFIWLYSQTLGLSTDISLPDHAIKLKFVAENHSWNVFCGKVRYTGNQSPVYVTSFMQETLVWLWPLQQCRLSNVCANILSIIRPTVQPGHFMHSPRHHLLIYDGSGWAPSSTIQ